MVTLGSLGEAKKSASSPRAARSRSRNDCSAVEGLVDGAEGRGVSRWDFSEVYELLGEWVAVGGRSGWFVWEWG